MYYKERVESKKKGIFYGFIIISILALFVINLFVKAYINSVQVTSLISEVTEEKILILFIVPGIIVILTTLILFILVRLEIKRQKRDNSNVDVQCSWKSFKWTVLCGVPIYIILTGGIYTFNWFDIANEMDARRQNSINLIKEGTFDYDLDFRWSDLAGIYSTVTYDKSNNSEEFNKLNKDGLISEETLSITTNHKFNGKDKYSFYTEISCNQINKDTQNDIYNVTKYLELDNKKIVDKEKFQEVFKEFQVSTNGEVEKQVKIGDATVVYGIGENSNKFTEGNLVMYLKFYNFYE